MSDDTPTSTLPQSSTPHADPNQRNRTIAAVVAVGAAALFLVVAIAVTRGGSDSGSDSTDASGDTWGGAQVNPGDYPRAQFTLTDTNGQPYDFAAQTQGKLTLLFFGYTHCPDVCPVQMATLTAALQTPAMPNPTVVFVTTDPARDTPERLREWLDGYDADYVGLTGTLDQITEAEIAARVPPSTIFDQASGDYEVGHAAQVIAYAPDDQAHVVYPSGVRRQDWLSDLPRMMELWGTG
jgi:protein SCO1/2